MVEGAGALLRVLPVRINANGKALTVEELDTMKKDMHLAAFRYAADELRRGLRRVAVERDAVGRLSRDWNRVSWDGKTRTVDGLLEKIERGAREVLAEHESADPLRYSEDGPYRHMVAEMLDAQVHAISALNFYLEDPTFDISAVLFYSNAELHRDYASFLRRKLQTLEETERAATAERLCRLLGLVRESVGERDREGLSPLMTAATGTAGTEALELLVCARADVHAVVPAGNRAGWTALMCAAAVGNVEAVKVLCRLDADVEAREVKGRTALVRAAMYGQVPAAQALLRAGAQLGALDLHRKTALSYAAEYGHADMVEALLDATAQIDVRDQWGETPLYVAAKNCQAAVVRLLCSRGAALSSAAEDGSTPLMAAAARGRLGAVVAICEAGMPWDAAGGGARALQLAEDAGHSGVAEYLRGRGRAVCGRGVCP